MHTMCRWLPECRCHSPLAESWLSRTRRPAAWSLVCVCVCVCVCVVWGEGAGLVCTWLTHLGTLFPCQQLLPLFSQSLYTQAHVTIHASQEPTPPHTHHSLVLSPPPSLVVPRGQSTTQSPTHNTQRSEYNSISYTGCDIMMSTYLLHGFYLFLQCLQFSGDLVLQLQRGWVRSKFKCY